eukprot:Rhum_TRINITY_DN25401_c0_g2::Rhum_TRINITY_DN25401_c0_g2_i1::g.182024::m.182024/K18932/ZDHHC; palmitoyltransferase
MARGTRKDEGAYFTAQGLSYVVSYVCIVLATAIITGTIFSYFNAVLPLLISSSDPAWNWLLVLCTWLSFNLIFNYTMVVSTEPGRASVSLMREADIQLAHEHKDNPAVKGLWCDKCDAPRPFRAHHCPLCGYCVLKMDHHCPWVGRCVGHYNHKYFILFLLYLWASVTFATVTISLNQFGWLVNPDVSQQTRTKVMGEVMVCFAVCAALTLVMTFFLAWTLYLILSNQTSIEHLTNRTGKTKNIYNHHSKWLNLRVLFGPSVTSLFQMLLPSTTLSEENGHTFALYSGLQAEYTDPTSAPSEDALGLAKTGGSV